MDVTAQTEDFGADGGEDLRYYRRLSSLAEEIPSFDDELPQFRAHWQVFFPTLVIALVYLVVWLYLALLGMTDSKLAKLAVIAIALLVPLLAVQALLRKQTVCVQVLDGHIRYHPGWPRRIASDIPADLVRNVVVKRGLAGRLFGGGTLRINLVTGQHVSISDMKEPLAAKADILAMLKEAKAGKQE